MPSFTPLSLLVQMVVVFPEERKLCYQVFKGEPALALLGSGKEASIACPCTVKKVESLPAVHLPRTLGGREHVQLRTGD